MHPLPENGEHIVLSVWGAPGNVSFGMKNRDIEKQMKNVIFFLHLFWFVTVCLLLYYISSWFHIPLPLFY